MKLYALFAAAILFAAVGITVGCVDLRDYVTVPDTSGAPDIASTDGDPATINEANRDLEVFAADSARYIAWRQADIAKREQIVGFIEGFASSGLNTLGETAGTWAGPFAPLVALSLGYLKRRKGDRTPEEVREEKEASYNAGREAAEAAFGIIVPKATD